MTNYQQILNTKEAEAWFEKHPDGVLSNSIGFKQNIVAWTCQYPPYTVEKTGNTITLDGTVYKEGDVIPRFGLLPHGIILEIAKKDIDPRGHDVKFLHIPDEVADKPAPKEPKTLTVEEAMDVDSFYWLNPFELKPSEVTMPRCIGAKKTAMIKACRAHVADGHKLYATREDAELGEELGWS